MEEQPLDELRVQRLLELGASREFIVRLVRKGWTLDQIEQGQRHVNELGRVAREREQSPTRLAGRASLNLAILAWNGFWWLVGAALVIGLIASAAGK